ncbi:HpcH/HpaI aldolase/citrate lyase family protein [Microbaculum marinum]|uniref:HpcH/HpaI aldolase/citrate lyase family protein n=1 Tax=Microbaculum marinum TaxID=1764581 RepID=A0AAW9RBV0_9HYPH
MDITRNAFKHAIAAGTRQIGLWSSLASNIAAEVIADSGFDWILFDTEHAPNEIPGLISQMQAAAIGTATPVVRPAWNDAVLIKRILDAGAQSILVPFVQTADEARQAVSAAKYPPAGIRGAAGTSRASRYGRVSGYLNTANDQICVLVQIETEEALGRIDEIAAVDGVDGVFIGPNDLSASMGYLGQMRHADVQAAIKRAIDALKAAGKPGGILTSNQEDARQYVEWGFTFVAVGSDLGLLAKSADALASRFRDL